MGILVGLDGERIDPLEEFIRAQLHSRGSVRADLNSLTVTTEHWRKTARAAARRLQRPVRTLIAGGAVHAILTDWPANERERAIHEATLRSAIRAVGVTESPGPINLHEPAAAVRPRGEPVMLSQIGRWDIEVDLDFSYNGTFTVRGSNVDAYHTADTLRAYLDDHGLVPYAVLTPEQDATGQFLPDHVHVHLVAVKPGEPVDHRASDYIGEASTRSARRLYQPMLERLTHGALPALPARIPRVLPVGRDRVPVFALLVNPSSKHPRTQDSRSKPF